MIYVSGAEVRDAERQAQKDRLILARQYLQIDKSKAPTAADVMELRRMKDAAANASPALDAVLAIPRASEFWACRALYFKLQNR